MKNFDLHAHPSLKAFGNTPADSEVYNIWKKRLNSFNGKQLLDQVDEDGFYRPLSWKVPMEIFTNLAEDSVAAYSQANLDDAIEGNVRCIVLSFYPVEQEFFKRGRKKPDSIFDKILSMISGQSVPKIDDVQDGLFSYFEEYSRDLALLKKSNGVESKKHPDWKYKIVNNVDELETAMAEEKTVALILSVEGVQSLSNKIGERNDFKKLKAEAETNGGSPAFEKWKKGLLENLRAVKRKHPGENQSLDNAPLLFLTVAHHFFNYVSGHCKSLKFTLFGYMLDQEGTYHDMQKGAYNGKDYFDVGITDFGKEVFREVLHQDEQENIRRIIIDIKHLSPQARLDFYELLDEEYNDQDIPIVCSHTSVNGISELRRTTHEDASLFFNVADINTFDRDVIEIYKRDGLIGIMLDDGRSCSKQIKTSLKVIDNEIERKLKRIERIRSNNQHRSGKWARMRMQHADNLLEKVNHLKEDLEDKYCDIFFNQVFYIINVLNNSNDSSKNAGEDAWKIITLGTDFDGVINPYDYYGSYSRMDEYRTDLAERWREHLVEAREDGTENYYTKFLFGRSPEYWLDRVFWENSQDFLKKYFHDDYLIKGLKR